MILIIVFLVFYFLLLIRTFIKRKKKGLSVKDIQYVRFHFEKIHSELEKNPKNAVIDADKLLDFALGKRGFGGNLGEKLKKAGPLFSDLNGVWNAHKLRNRIAHELGEINKSEAKMALDSFKRGLKDLGV